MSEEMATKNARRCSAAERRSLLLSSGAAILLAALPFPASALVEIGNAPDKAATRYPDYVFDAETGLQYKDLEVGSGDKVVVNGSQVVVDWAGVTVGYYGRIFEARNNRTDHIADKHRLEFRSAIAKKINFDAQIAAQGNVRQRRRTHHRQKRRDAAHARKLIKEIVFGTKHDAGSYHAGRRDCRHYGIFALGFGDCIVGL